VAGPGGIAEAVVYLAFTSGEVRQRFRLPRAKRATPGVGVGSKPPIGVLRCRVHQDARNLNSGGPKAIEDFVAVGVDVTPVIQAGGIG
jgi:hypothetical protein